jgi:hypothetical protein
VVGDPLAHARSYIKRMKRSSSIRLVLLGGFSAGALAASTAAAEARITPESYYTNDYFIGGVGYYHAPFRGFYARPYNDYDAARKMYYYGGQWGPAPHQSIVNISAPTPRAAQLAQSQRTDLRHSTPIVPVVHRSGFGSTSGSHTIRS